VGQSHTTEAAAGVLDVLGRLPASGCERPHQLLCFPVTRDSDGEIGIVGGTSAAIGCDCQPSDKGVSDSQPVEIPV
jgi:hypothetical protein